MGGQWKAGAVVVAAAAALAGCGSISSTHHPDAFSAKKTYAVASVMARDKPGTAANEIMERTYPSALRALRATNLKVTEVKGHKSYRAMAEDAQPKGPLSQPHTVAKGYKYFSEEKLVKLARELKVDGLITMALSYDAVRGTASKKDAGAAHKAQTTVSVRAIDANGKTVWSDSATAESGQSVPDAAGAADFAKLRPLFAESTDKAVRKLMENFAAKTKM